MDVKPNLDDSERNNTNYTISGLLNSLANQNSENTNSENDVECSTSKFGKNCFHFQNSFEHIRKLNYNIY